MDKTEDLDMIRASAAAYVAASAGVGPARRVHEGGSVLQGNAWRDIAELGWIGMAVPERRGGLDLGASAVVAVAEECGRTLLTPPLTMGIAAAAALAEGGAQAQATLAALMAGEVHVALGVAALREDAKVIAPFVPDGDAADQWILALGSGERFEARLLSKDALGVSSSTRTGVDGSRLADIAIDADAWMRAPRVLCGPLGEEGWEHAAALLRLGDAAYLCGLMMSALDMAVDYLKLRRQFGVPIGTFQALQHRAASCHVDVTATRALVHEAALSKRGDRARWAAAASVHRAGLASLRVTKEVVQFHGAIGFADEHDAGLYMRRAMSIGARHAEGALLMMERTAPSTPARRLRPR